MSGSILSTIHSPADVHALDADDLPALCDEIRDVLIAFGKAHGGHIGSNLGMVEATVALHRVFDSPRDAIVFDVSHQSYVHKMLTGRARAYLDPALGDTVSGFTNPRESEHDRFVLGHTGTSISLACGLAKLRDMEGRSGNVIAVIGDGSLSSAVAFEGLNNAAEQGGNLIIVFNDNEMSIAEDFGGMYGSLARLRASGGTAQPNIFEAFSLGYRYVEDGNDVAALTAAFAAVRDTDRPVVVHIHTVKGLGLPAPSATAGAACDPMPTASAARHGGGERDPQPLTAGRCEANHWQDPDRAAARPLGARKHYGQLAMAALEPRFATEPGLVVISPATPGSNGITRAFRERAGAHYVDTGIAEEHAVAFASGLARDGGRPVLATSATFFQRTFDQLQQELALNATPATLLDFGGGISNADNTHSGAFDIAMFANIPGLTCLAPTSGRAFLDMLGWASGPANSGPVVIRVPGDRILAAERAAERDTVRAGACARGYDAVPTASGMPVALAPPAAPTMPWSRYRIDHAGSRVAILALGDMYPLAVEVRRALAEARPGTDSDCGTSDSAPVEATLIDPQQFSTLDKATLRALYERHEVVVTLEDGQLDGGWGHTVAAFYANDCAHDQSGDQSGAQSGDAPRQPRGEGRYGRSRAMRVLTFGAAKEFTDRVPLAELESRYGLTVDAIVERVRRALA